MDNAHSEVTGWHPNHPKGELSVRQSVRQSVRPQGLGLACLTGTSTECCFG